MSFGKYDDGGFVLGRSWHGKDGCGKGGNASRKRAALANELAREQIAAMGLMGRFQFDSQACTILGVLRAGKVAHWFIQFRQGNGPIQSLKTDTFLEWFQAGRITRLP